MSPITHAFTGWILSQPLEKKSDRLKVTIASVVSDIDGLTLIAGIENYQTYHHTFGHNIFLGLIFASFCLINSEQKLKCFFLALISFNSHILSDLLGSGEGWGIYYFWPFSEHEFAFSPPFQWELASWQNLIITLGLMLAIFILGLKKDRTILELMSVKKDKELIAIFKKWIN